MPVCYNGRKPSNIYVDDDKNGMYY
jgi:hypothetical protein